MIKKAVVLLVCWTMVALTGMAMAQQKQQPQPQPLAGTQPMVMGITVDELTLVARGWSVKRQILGKNVYNDKKQKIGRVDDLIVSPDQAVFHAIIGAGGFLGIERHDVAIPMNQFTIEKGKIMLPGATKEALKSMPKFQYAR